MKEEERGINYAFIHIKRIRITLKVFYLFAGVVLIMQ